MKKYFVVSLCLVLFAIGLQGAYAQLSNEAQADLKQQQIIRAVQEQNFRLAYQQFEEYDALGVTMPTPLLFIRAQVSFKENDFIGTKAYLEQYINNSERGTDNYNQALSMYSAVESKADEQAKQQAEQARLAEQAEVQARIQAKVAEFNQNGLSLLPEMITIPAGQFDMGSTEGSDEQPIHSVSISSYKLASTETTQALWQAVMGDNPSLFEGDNRPVEEVYWDDIQDFIAILNSATGQKYRLPSESEWEYAARAGTTTKYFWGNRSSKSRANYGSSETKEVGSYEANEWGLYDMHGNVEEWVQDCYVDSYNGAPVTGEARVSDGCSDRVLRGGSWDFNASDMRSANRNRDSPSYRKVSYGFRLAQDN